MVWNPLFIGIPMPSRETEPSNGGEVAGPAWSPELGTRLDALIKAAGGPTKASTIVGVVPEQVSKWRDGKARAPFWALAALSAETGVSLDWLATGAGPMRREEVSGASDQGLYQHKEGAAPAHLREAPAAYGWDPQLMEDCIVMVNELAGELDRQLDALVEAKLIFELYRLELERKQQGQRLRTAEVVRLFNQAG